MKKVLKRNEIEKNFKWAIEDLYKSDSLWEEDFEKLQVLIKELAGFEDKLLEKIENLAAFLKKKDEASILNEKVYVYANQKYHEDTNNAIYQSMSGRASGLMMDFESSISFFLPEISGLTIEELQAYCRMDTHLKIYEKYLIDILNKREHILSKEMELLLAKAGEMSETSENIFSMFNNADLKFPDIKNEKGEMVQITNGRYITFLQNRNRDIRKNAFFSVYNTYGQFKNTLAAAYIGNIKKDIFYSSARKYDTDLSMYLNENRIPVEVYKNLINTVHENLGYMYEYIKLRKLALKVDELHMYDLYVDIVEETEKVISFEKAKEIVIAGLMPLGEEYIDILKEGFENRWIDIYENEGKRSGAYSWGAYSIHPFVLLNHQDNLNSVFTLAHEMGHALHSYYSDKNQPYIYAGYKIFVAEVASTCNEALLMSYLLNNTDNKAERAYLINYYLEQFRTTLYRQTMFAEFEIITHEKEGNGEALTADELCSIYYDLNKKYFGNDIVIDKEIAMEWARIPHFYTSFYVYQYATGYSAAIALSKRILNGEKNAVEDYKKFLSGGSSMSPIELLKMAGVDMSSKKPIEDALSLFGELVKELKALIL